MNRGRPMISTVEMELEVVADPEPDELGGIELRRHIALLEPEQPCARSLLPARRHRYGDVLQLHRGDMNSPAET
jgi:hypothetical protein